MAIGNSGDGSGWLRFYRGLGKPKSRDAEVHLFGGKSTEASPAAERSMAFCNAPKPSADAADAWDKALTQLPSHAERLSRIDEGIRLLEAERQQIDVRTRTSGWTNENFAEMREYLFVKQDVDEPTLIAAYGQRVDESLKSLKETRHRIAVEDAWEKLVKTSPEVAGSITSKQHALGHINVLWSRGVTDVTPKHLFTMVKILERLDLYQHQENTARPGGYANFHADLLRDVMIIADREWPGLFKSAPEVLNAARTTISTRSACCGVGCGDRCPVGVKSGGRKKLPEHLTAKLPPFQMSREFEGVIPTEPGSFNRRYDALKPIKPPKP